jgi:arginine repressor
MTRRELPLFDGATYDQERDGARLTSQLTAVRIILSDGHWRTLEELRNELALRGIHASEAGISARVRDLRKAKFGGYQVYRQHIKNGLWAYAMRHQ